MYIDILKLFIRYKLLKLKGSKLLGGGEEIAVGVKVLQMHFMLKH